MGDGDRAARQLLGLAAALRDEVARLRRGLAELEEARERLGGAASRLEVYGAAALLDSFYTGVEKAVKRTAVTFGLLPEGPAWHRTLLDDAALDVPRVRPPVLDRATIARLQPYLGFRHRFRNLYVHDMDVALLRPLLDEAGEVGEAVCADLERFVQALAWCAEG